MATNKERGRSSSNELFIGDPPFLSLTNALLFPLLFCFQHVNSLDEADEDDPLSTGDFGAGI